MIASKVHQMSGQHWIFVPFGQVVNMCVLSCICLVRGSGLIRFAIAFPQRGAKSLAAPSGFGLCDPRAQKLRGGRLEHATRTRNQAERGKHTRLIPLSRYLLAERMVNPLSKSDHCCPHTLFGRLKKCDVHGLLALPMARSRERIH